MIDKPRLVLLSGYPRAGKTTVAGYLQELGFVRIARSPLREMLFGRTAPELTEDHDFKPKEYDILWPTVNYMKLGLLPRGCDVVIDASAVYNDMRRQLLDTLSIDVEKHLIVLRTAWNEVVRREMERSGDLGYLQKLASDWQEPSPDLGCPVIEYHNNIPEDLETIKADLHSRFKKRG